ncbi:septation protein A [Ferrimonas marina]|uniref:Inner membrane-spanning protein YciB n=1 Tax=Ferrimonas marina TaxID=299255 RepID=A0A1M5SEW4_9GAMM|nr:septation protein A [Ferrimonas marina]SHH37066.1 intracellular septation protein [Ferrimonas marina]
MKQLLDFLPLLVFFAVYKFYGIIPATGAIVVASAVQTGLMYALYRKVEKMHLVTFGLLVVFGGLTVAFNDDAFIKWKVTIVYGLFAAALLISQWMGKPVMKAMLGKEITLPEIIWARIGYAWAAFFTFCAGLNLYVAFTMSQDTWVIFKVFYLMGMTFAFLILTIVYLYRHMPKEDEQEQDKQ